MKIFTLGVIAGSIVLAALSTGNALANLGGLDRVAAPAVFGIGQGRAAAARADAALLAFDKTRAPRDLNRAGSEAAAALRLDPLNHRAARVSGFVSLDRRNSAAAASQLRLAERITRRNLAVQLWMIEDNVDRGDLGGTLRHYDIALRTNIESGGLLFPLLASALADPEMRTAFAPYVRRPRVWLDDFAIFAAERGPEPVAFARVVRHAGGLRDTRHLPAAKRVLTALFARNFDGEGLRFYATIPGASPSLARRVDFVPGTVDAEFSPATWGVTSGGQISAALETDSRTKSLRYRVWAPAGVGGIAIEKALALPAGSYSLGSSINIVEGGKRARPYWRLRCSSSQGEALTQRVEVSTAGRLQVPGDCPAQRLSLIVESDNDAVDGEYIVFSPELRRQAPAGTRTSAR